MSVACCLEWRALLFFDSGSVEKAVQIVSCMKPIDGAGIPIQEVANIAGTLISPEARDFPKEKLLSMVQRGVVWIQSNKQTKQVEEEPKPEPVVVDVEGDSCNWR